MIFIQWNIFMWCLLIMICLCTCPSSLLFSLHYPIFLSVPFLFVSLSTTLSFYLSLVSSILFFSFLSPLHCHCIALLNMSLVSIVPLTIYCSYSTFIPIHIYTFIRFMWFIIWGYHKNSWWLLFLIIIL